MLPGSMTFRNYASVWCKTDKLEVAAGLCWSRMRSLPGSDECLVCVCRQGTGYSLFLGTC